MSLPYNYVSNIAASQTKEFFRPKSTFEQIQLILSVTWFIIAFFGSINLQAYLFFAIIVMIVINNVYLFLYKKPRSSFLNTIFKFGLYFFLFIFLRNPGLSQLDFFAFSIDDIILVQKSTLSILLLIGVGLNYVELELLKPSSKSKILTNYLDFSFQIMKGIGYAIYLTIFFDLIGWIPNLVVNPSSFPNVQDILLIAGSFFLIIASQGPEGDDYRQMLVKELFLVSQNRIERARDAILKVSILILFLLRILPIFTTSHETLVTEQYWNDAATLLLVIGIISFFLGFFGDKSSPQKYSSSKINEKMNEYLPHKLTSFRESLQDVSIKPDTQQFFKLTQDMPLVDKGNTRFVARKNSVAIPIKESPEGTSVIFVGESDIENITDKGNKAKESLEEMATAILIPNNTWNKVNLSLEAFKPTDETIKALALKGIESKEKLVTLAESTLSDFKNVANFQIVKQGFRGVVDNFQKGKYFVSDTSKGTVVKLPGITVIDNSETTFVRVFGIKVLESNGYTVVNLPFVKVIESPDYQLVKLPGLNVIEAGNSNLVNIAGFQILDGDRQAIEDAKNRIQNEAHLLDTAFNRIDDHISGVLDNPDSFLLAKNASGKKLELLTGGSSDKALVGGNLLTISLPNNPIKFETGSSKSKSKVKVKPDKKIESSAVKELSFEESDSDIDSQSYEDKINASPELQKLDKLYKIVKMSHESIDLERLAKFLDFDSVSELESWLVNKNIPNLQINWSKSQLVINDNTLKGIKKLLPL